MNKRQETVSLEELQSLQIDKLKKVIKFAAKKSSFYRHKKNLLSDHASFRSLGDFSKNIPFTTKDDLRQCGTYENLCVPKEDIAEVHFSSGTSGKAVFSFLTKKDIKESNEYLARTWHMQGMREEGTFAMLASYGLFSAGLINHYAIEALGTFIIPLGNSSATKTLDILKEFSVDSCAAVASYYLYLIKIAEINNFNLGDLRLKRIVGGGEPFSEKQRQYIEEKLHASLYDQYGLCEINTGIAGECPEKDGLHILADYVYPEIIDPVTGDLLEDEKEGELVLTTFHKEASPLIRYRTGDITRITHKPCPCGRTMPRISRIQRRVIETLFYKGIKIERSYIENLLEDLQTEVDPYVWQMEVDSVSGKDELTFRFSPKKNDKKTLDRVTAYFKKNLGFKVQALPFNSNDLVRLGSSKLKYFIDKREI